jgi:hypothetical protein
MNLKNHDEFFNGLLIEFHSDMCTVMITSTCIVCFIIRTNRNYWNDVADIVIIVPALPPSYSTGWLPYCNTTRWYLFVVGALTDSKRVDMVSNETLSAWRLVWLKVGESVYIGNCNVYFAVRYVLSPKWDDVRYVRNIYYTLTKKLLTVPVIETE